MDNKQEQKPIGYQVEEELKSLYEQKKFNITIDELKSKAPKSYNIIFENYEKDKDNGIETSFYRLLETTTNNFKLDKK